MKKIDTIVIGGGQAGLAISYYLKEAGRDHLVLERDRVGCAWRKQRWDSFTLVTPNWTLGLPGMEYGGEDPDGFLSREETVAYLEDFVARFDPPVREGIEAWAVEPQSDGDGSLIRTSAGKFQAKNVVVATGTYQRPKIPSLRDRLDESVRQIHTSQYRNPDQLPPGAVLVVGSGQSGCQIAEELQEHGRQVYLSVGSSGRAPRRYRGEDAVRWMERIGFFDRTVDDLDSPADRFRPSLHVSGKGGGRTLNLHQFHRDGMVLLGHLRDGAGTQLTIEPDLHQSLAAADKAASEFKGAVDRYIRDRALEAPVEDAPELKDGFEAPLLTELDLTEEGIRTILWATGYMFDYSWVKYPVFDKFGYPVQERGVTSEPGVFFLGLHWLHTIKSGLLYGVGEDASYLAEQIDLRETGM